MGSIYEWEQPESETGVEKQLSVSPKQGKTKIRFIAQWKALEIIMVYFALFAGAGLGMFLFNLFQMSGAWFFTLPLLGSIAGFGLSRLYFKRYFEKQKSQYAQIVAAIVKRLKRAEDRKPLLDEVELGNEGKQVQGRSADSLSRHRVAQDKVVEKRKNTMFFFV